MKLTKSQQMMLDIEKIVGGSINVIYGTVIIDTLLNVDEMKKAVNRMYRLNPVLRTRLVNLNGKVEQIIEEYHEQEIEVINFKTKDDVHAYANENAQIPFDMNGSLCSLKIFVADDFCGVAYKLHHIISDGWTLSLIASHFDSIINGKEPTAYSFDEHILAEDKYLQCNRYEKDKAFFLEQFEKCPEPTLFSDEKITDLRGRRRSYILTQEQVKAIKKFTEENNCSVSSLFLSALSIYFNKTRNNAEKFYIGIPYLNRVGNIEKNTAGLFINTTPTLIELDNNESLLSNIRKIEENVFATMRHQKFDFEDILTQLNEKLNFTGSLHDVLYSYQNAQISGKNFLSTWYHNGMQSEALQFHIDDRDNAGILRLHYDTRFAEFTDEQVDALHESICTTVFNIINNPQKELRSTSVLTEKQKEQILYSFNNTKHEYDVPKGSSIYSLFDDNARRNLDKICLRADNKKITFGEFLNMAEQLDCEIRKYTKGKKCVIGVLADRSVEMYAAIYGIIRGGNAYMPISPDYPQERITYMLENSNAPLTLAQGKFCSLAGQAVLNVSEFIDNLPQNDVIPFSCEEDDTAYVIYTSGSTGNPKGAKVSHKSAVNRILWMHDKYPLLEDGVILQKTPYTFDVSVWEIFWWGMLGGSLAASKPNEHFLPAKILEETQKNSVTHLHFVPSVFELFLIYLESHNEECQKFSTVQKVFLSGEALSASLVNRFYDLFDYDKVSLHNLYGPTECAVDVTYFDCAPGECDPVPIGSPIYNTSMYVVDKYLNPVPPGVTGELCIGGVNVGQGYLNNPHLTAEKFIDNPFADGKLYKTGDRALWREDGEIIFCGRMDNQIKLNGQRIELGEIESVIASAAGVDAVVVFVKHIENRDTLVAVCRCDSTLKKEIEAICKEKLPSYMIPQAFAFIDEMPLNPSGKLDRKYLASLDFSIKPHLVEPPQNETEKAICHAFCDILNISDVGRSSDFFDLGGTSLSMISILSKDIFADISAAEFIENATPEKLAALLNPKEKKCFNYVKTLHEPPEAQKALILFPFAGGGAESYAALTKAFANISDSTALYFVDYLHSDKQTYIASREIAQLSQSKEIFIYSHCAGSAVAMSVINTIEQQGLCTIKHYIAGGFIPMKKPQRSNFWNKMPDFILKKILVNAGAGLSALDKSSTKYILREFRRDTDFMTDYFNKARISLECPVSLVINKADIFTQNHADAINIWSRYARTINGTFYIESDSHYFQTDNADTLAEIINSII
ncbi:MAG: amino acid adenylation domain-containing protein [Clostridia bacterium]|nr:amino acid adenylation domain-containing protein [Clostridia bacterium]